MTSVVDQRQATFADVSSGMWVQVAGVWHCVAAIGPARGNPEAVWVRLVGRTPMLVLKTDPVLTRMSAP